MVGGRVGGNKRSQDLMHLRDGSKDTAFLQAPRPCVSPPLELGRPWDGSALSLARLGVHRSGQGLWRGHSSERPEQETLCKRNGSKETSSGGKRGKERPKAPQRQATVPGPAGGSDTGRWLRDRASWPPLGSLHKLCCPQTPALRIQHNTPKQEGISAPRSFSTYSRRPDGKGQAESVPCCTPVPRCAPGRRGAAGSHHQPGQLRGWDRRQSKGNPEARGAPHSHRESPVRPPVRGLSTGDKAQLAPTFQVPTPHSFQNTEQLHKMLSL